MLALFEILSLEGYSDYRDIVVERVGPVSCNSNSLFFYVGKRFNCSRSPFIHYWDSITNKLTLKINKTSKILSFNLSLLLTLDQ